MILVIRISGMVEVPSIKEETMFRLKLRRKYAAVLVKDTEENRKLLEGVRDYVAYGVINEEMIEKLIAARGKRIDKKIDTKMHLKSVAEDIKKGKSMEEVGYKGFFRLHSPRKGIESKKHFGVGKGVLGNNKNDIDKLVGRML